MHVTITTERVYSAQLEEISGGKMCIRILDLGYYYSAKIWLRSLCRSSACAVNIIGWREVRQTVHFWLRLGLARGDDFPRLGYA